jgi:hypothetical protein
LWLIKTDDFGAIPEGLSIMAIVLLSSVVWLVGSYLGKRPKIRNSNSCDSVEVGKTWSRSSTFFLSLTELTLEGENVGRGEKE